MTEEIKKTEALIRCSQVLREMFQNDPPPATIPFHATVGLDERYQRATLLERTIPSLLPAQP